MSSAYERARLENIALNRSKLVALGLEEDLNSLRAKAPRAVKGADINKRPKPEAVPPRQRSLRLQSLDADGQPLPDREAKPSPTPEPVTKRARKTTAPLDAAKVSTGSVTAEEAASFLARLHGRLADRSSKGEAGATSIRSRSRSAAPTKQEVAPSPSSIDAVDLGQSLKITQNLTLDDDDIAKLVPERIFSLAIHPYAKPLVIAGDTWGRIGLWDADAPSTELPVITLAPHTRPVSGVRVLAHAPHKLLSCSHDGTVRCLDLGSGADSNFVELYRAPEDSDGDYPSLYGLGRKLGHGGDVPIARHDGAVTLLDLR